MFSIILPVYNVEAYLKQCIESVLTQSYTEFELLIVDDGSTDKSVLLCEQYAKKDNRIKFISKQNSGVADTRNIALKQATQPYIIFVDGDDYLANGALEQLAHQLKKTPDVALCSFERQYPHQKNHIFNRYEALTLKEAMSAQHIVKELYDTNMYECSIWTNVYRRQFLIDNDLFFNTTLKRHSDEEWFLKVMLLGKATIVLNTLLYHTRAEREQSISNVTSYTRSIYKIQLAANLKDFVKQCHIPDKALRRRINLALCSHYLMGVLQSKRFTKVEQQQILSVAKKQKHVLNVATSAKQKLAAILIMVIGFKATLSILK